MNLNQTNESVVENRPIDFTFAEHLSLCIQISPAMLHDFGLQLRNTLLLPKASAQLADMNILISI